MVELLSGGARELLGLLVAVGPLVVELGSGCSLPWMQSTGSEFWCMEAVVVACGAFPDQGINLYPLR